MRKLKYFGFWIIPFTLLCLCGYNSIWTIWLAFTATDKWTRLDGFVYEIFAIFYGVLFVVASAIALALTVYSYRKEHPRITDEEK